jgi:CRISPR-associated endonuclease/helicase Cas3
MPHFAHSGKQQDKSDWQLLSDHLLSVAELAAKMASSFRLEKAAFLAGLFHDLGKYGSTIRRPAPNCCWATSRPGGTKALRNS